MAAPRRSRWLVVLTAALIVTVLPASARALPGDPPIELLSPPDAASLRTDPDGIAVTFTCPGYRTSSAGEFFTAPGDSRDYSVRFATAPQTGTDGRLLDGNRVDVAAAETSNSLPDGQCVAGLYEFPTSGPGPQQVSGTYYWQVARSCPGCAGGYETSEVRKFSLSSAVRLRVGGPSVAYSGFDRAVPLSASGVPDAATVVLERRSNGAWRTIARAVARGGRASVDVRLPTGTQSLRLRATVGAQSSTSPVRRIRVLSPGRARRLTSRRDDGRYRGTAQDLAFGFRVARAGHELRDVSIPINLVCPGLEIGRIRVQRYSIEKARVPVAPDGRFVGRVSLGEYQGRFSGRIRGRRLSEGSFELLVGACVGGPSTMSAHLAR